MPILWSVQSHNKNIWIIRRELYATNSQVTSQATTADVQSSQWTLYRILIILLVKIRILLSNLLPQPKTFTLGNVEYSHDMSVFDKIKIIKSLTKSKIKENV